MVNEEFVSKISKMNFEQALTELERIVTKLESGNETLDNAINSYEYGNMLKDYCEKKLSEAKLKIDKIVKKTDGTVTLENFLTD